MEVAGEDCNGRRALLWWFVPRAFALPPQAPVLPAPLSPQYHMKPRSYRPFTRKDIDSIALRGGFSNDRILAMKAISAVLPFRVNDYVIEELIRWEDVPEDPIFQLVFPQPGMLEGRDLDRMIELVHRQASKEELTAAAQEIRLRLNPHPAGQMELNTPRMDGEIVPGMQHKYRETVLFFPSRGQTCHAYCGYCFRWPQFVGDEKLKFANRESLALARYVAEHPEVSDVLITGGDPLIMRSAHMREIIEPLLDPDLEHVRDIRIGTKSLAWWPYRFVTDKDADDLLRLFEQVVESGRHLALMAHASHPREFETPIVQTAIRRIKDTGAVIRCQAPLIRHVNDSAQIWADMWRTEVRMGAVPYYMFVERDTGANRYFEVPLARAHKIFRSAYRQVTGLARTVRGPSMSATSGKVSIVGTARIGGEKVFVLEFLQGRCSDWVGHPFFAAYDDKATWLDQLRPAFGEAKFFFERDEHQFGSSPIPSLPEAAPISVMGAANMQPEPGV